MTIRTIDLAGMPFQFSGRPGDPYFDHLGEGTDNEFLARVATTLPQNAAIFDVGANVGMTAALMARHLERATIHCFEPSPQAFPHLAETLALNNLSRCHPAQLALGARIGEASFMDNPDSASASHLAPDGTGTVRVSTVDVEVSIRSPRRLDFIKIDVEGYEADVLAGAARTLGTLRPRVFVEFNIFTLMAFGDTYPRAFLEKLVADFPFVYRFVEGRLVEVRTQPEQIHFLHDNLIHKGCVDDLFCCWEPVVIS